jgi:orotate phosphoribosyltransferase
MKFKNLKRDLREGSFLLSSPARQDFFFSNGKRKKKKKLLSLISEYKKINQPDAYQWIQMKVASEGGNLFGSVSTLL